MSATKRPRKIITFRVNRLHVLKSRMILDPDGIVFLIATRFTKSVRLVMVGVATRVFPAQRQEQLIEKGTLLGAHRMFLIKQLSNCPDVIR